MSDHNLSQPYSKLEANGRIALFVNSETVPDREIPLDHYTYRGEGKDLQFFRLYRITYVMDEIIEYSLYNWRRVEVKSYCHSTMKQLIDSMKGAKSLLQ